MKTMTLSLLSAFVLSALVLGPVVMAAEPNKSAAPKTSEPTKDAATTCMVDTMQGFGTTEEGSKAMQEFMQSPKGARAMNNMMEMMGGQSGMMGGQAIPETHQPK